jgi:hypothetical protein
MEELDRSGRSDVVYEKVKKLSRKSGKAARSTTIKRGCGTRDAIGVMRVLCERSLEHENDTYICFVDFEKAFDRVN